MGLHRNGSRAARPRNGISRTAPLALAASLCLAACSQAPDLRGVEHERALSIQRYDIVQSLAFNGKVLVGGTQDGAVLVSADDGKSWARKQLGAVSMIGLASCPDGGFVGIDFYHQVWSAGADGGGWTAHKLDKPGTPLAVTCDGSNRWWVAGTRARIAMSADHGASWQVTDLKEDAQLTTIQMVNAQFGIATGEFGMVVTTHDGGATWQRGTPIPNEFYPYAALFLSPQEGWVSGLAGQILYTIDGGASWQKQENTTQAPLYRLFVDDGTPYGVGAGGVVARLQGEAWHAVPYPDAVPAFLGAGTALTGQGAIAIGGPGGLLRTVATRHN